MSQYLVLIENYKLVLFITNDDGTMTAVRSNIDASVILSINYTNCLVCVKDIESTIYDFSGGNFKECQHLIHDEPRCMYTIVDKYVICEGSKDVIIKDLSGAIVIRLNLSAGFHANTGASIYFTVGDNTIIEYNIETQIRKTIFTGKKYVTINSIDANYLYIYDVYDDQPAHDSKNKRICRKTLIVGFINMGNFYFNNSTSTIAYETTDNPMYKIVRFNNVSIRADKIDTVILPMIVDNKVIIRGTHTFQNNPDKTYCLTERYKTDTLSIYELAQISNGYKTKAAVRLEF